MSCTVGNVDLRDVVVQTANSVGVPPEIALGVAVIESGICQYRPNGQLVISSAGAIGVMQLEPATAAALGVDATDPYDNIRGGCMYLAQMFAKYGSWQLALAAYNWGPKKVDMEIRARGGYPNGFPSGVISYVNNVMARAYTYGNAIAATRPTAPPPPGPPGPDLTSSFDYSSTPPAPGASPTLIAVGIVGAIGVYLALS